MSDEKDFQKRIQCIGELVRELDQIADPAARTATKELVQVLMDLHGTGLERMLEITFESGEQGQKIVDKLGDDSLVSSLLVLYGIHPLDLETRVARALERARPGLRKHGCEFEVLSIQDATVRVRAQVGEHSCGSTAKTVQTMIEDAVYEAAPDIASLTVEGLEGKPANGFVGLDTLIGNHAPASVPSGRGLAERGDEGPLMSERPMPGVADAFGTLRQFARKQRPLERCELCGLGIVPDHPHLIEVAQRKLTCACDACAMLFGGQANAKYKRVPRRVRMLTDFHMTDAQWDGLLIPINMAFFYQSSLDKRVVALYPSPAGAMESLLALETWTGIVESNPELRTMESDVEALLANRVGQSRGAGEAEYFILPIDECYKLVGVIRTHWKGLSGGTEVWQELAHYFAGLRGKAVTPARIQHA